MTATTVSIVAPTTDPALKDDNRDVVDIWKDALKAYKNIVGFDLSPKFTGTSDMINHGVSEMNAFHRFRHNEKKVDKLRSLFAANLDYLEAGGQQLLAAATPAFPPAAAIGTALTLMLTACRQVSADYDVVVAFFEDMNAFLQRIVILETRMPRYKAYQNCLMDVFTSFLTMCGFAHKYIELKRFKKWIQNLVFGHDEELGGARKNMDTQLNRLQSATEFAILANTEESRRMELELLRNSEEHNTLLQAQRAALEGLEEKTDHIHNGVVRLMEAFQEQKKMHQELLRGGSGGGGERKKLAAAAKDKPASAKRIRNMMPDVEGEIDEYNTLEETMVEETCTWMFAEEQWKTWMQHTKSDETHDTQPKEQTDAQANALADAQPEQQPGPEPERQEQQPFLAIVGEPGVGKSHLAATAFDKLWKDVSEDPERHKHNCAAHFYFREQHESLSDFSNAVITIVNQVVEQSATLCEIINEQYQRDEVTLDVYLWQDLMNKLLGHAFRKESKNRLYLVFDGIDELDSLDEFIEFVQIIREKELRISLIFTTRPNVLSELTDVGPISELSVTKERQLADIKTLVWHRLNTLGNLRTFGRYVKQRIADKVEEIAPHMLYAEHVLVRFDSLAREGAVLRDLDKPFPPTLNELYDRSLESVHRRVAGSHQDLIKTFVHLVAFSFRALNLYEVTSLLQHLTGIEDFEIEEILQPLSSFIRVGDPGADAEARAALKAQGGYGTTVDQLKKKSESVNTDSLGQVYNDASLNVKFKERSMRSFFRNGTSSDTEKEGSLKQQGSCSLRWTPSEAHRRLFLMTAKLAVPTGTAPEYGARQLGFGFKKYSTHYALQHFRRIKPDEHSAEEKAEVLEAAWKLFTNQDNFAAAVEWNQTKYGEIWPQEEFGVITQWAEAAKSGGLSLSDSTREWAEDLVQNPERVFLSLAKAHLARLYDSGALEQTLTRLTPLRHAIEVSKSAELIETKSLELFPEAWNSMFEDEDEDEDDWEDEDEDGDAADDNDDKDQDQADDENSNIDETEGDEGDENEKEEEEEEENNSVSNKELVLAILGLFEDVQVTPQAHRVVAELLLKFGHREPAETTCTKALELIPAENQLERFRALALMAQILSKRGRPSKARQFIAQYAVPEYLENDKIPPTVKRQALLTKARIDKKNGEKDSAYQAYLDAKAASPDTITPGEVLDAEISLFSEPKDTDVFFKALKTWNPLEKLTWLSWDFDEWGVDLRIHLVDRAAQAGELPFVVKTYEEAIKYLDNVNAGAPMRCALAEVWAQGYGDLEKARQVLNEVFDSSSTGWPYAITEQYPDEVLLEAMEIQTFILFSLFRESKDPVRKKELLDELVGLPTRPLALDVPPSADTNMIFHRLAVTRMLLKMGPAAEFQKRLTEDIEACITGLRDKVGWNDGRNLSELARALYILSTAIHDAKLKDELQWTASVLASARFSRLTVDEEEESEDEDDDSDYDDDDDESDEEEEEENEGKGGNDDKDDNEDDNDNDDDDDEEAPSDEGDLYDDEEYEWGCEGNCNPGRVFGWWGKRVAYECYTCTFFLCEECHAALIPDKKDKGVEEVAKREVEAETEVTKGEKETEEATDKRRRKYCGSDHEFVRMPVEGWKGVRDGKITIEGGERAGEYVFDDLLTKIRDDLCKKAWDMFWEGA